MKGLTPSLFAIFLFTLTHTCMGQGMLISIDPVPLPRPIVLPDRPTPPQSYKIKELSVNARIKEQVAQIHVTQAFVNTGSTTIEVSFCFPLPYDGAVNQMTFMVDGKEYAAKLLPAKEAKDIYLNHVRRNQDPALLEWIGTGMFQTSVFPVPAGAERKVSIQLTQLLRKTDRLTDFLYPLSTARFTSQPVESLRLSANIESSSKIKSVYSPTHSVNVQRPDDFHAQVSYEAKNSIPSNDFRLMFDTAETEIGATLISYRPDSKEDGYFLLLASPEVKAEAVNLQPKTVILVLDRSGSMSGKKIEQAREALKFVLNNLREGDLFNVVAYDSNIESFRAELQRFDSTSRTEALGWVNGLYAGGSTNISGALTTALKMIQDSERPSYAVFLTDGLPTAGETNELKIAALVQQSNAYRTRMVNFGVGYDVNSRLLDRLSRDNFGVSEFVRPDEDIEQHVSRLYRSMSAPVMTDVHVTVELDRPASEVTPAINRIYPKTLVDVFAGQQLVLVGRYQSHGAAKVVISGTVGQSTSQLEFPTQLSEISNEQTFSFVESLWAIRRIGEIIDELDLSGSNQELISELVTLATKHGIVTPYTSFLADETSSIRQLADAEGNARKANELVNDQLSQTEGQFAFEQRAAKKSMRESNQVNRSGGFGLGGAGANQAAQSNGFGGSLVPGSAARTESEASAHSVQNVGNMALYRRGDIWVAENAKDIDLDKDTGKFTVVERFSDEYFQLVAENSPSDNAVLASQQPKQQMLVRFRERCYLIR